MQIKELILEAADPAALKRFYEEKLELPVAVSKNSITISTASSRLVFKKTNKGKPFYHFAFTIPANSIEKAHAWLKDKVQLVMIGDYKSEIADFVNWHAKSVYFFDAAGNIVELIARFDFGNATDEPFSSSQFLSISEVGLVFNSRELDEKTNQLLAEYNLSYFDKQPPLPQFKALGNDEGLFIIAPAGRSWYPTTVPCGIFPMEVKFEEKGKKWELKV